MDAEKAFSWTREIERVSSTLGSAWRNRRVNYTPRVGFRAALIGSGSDLRVGSLFTDPATGAPLLDPATVYASGRSRTVADVVMPGLMGGKRGRLRAFYLHPPRTRRHMLTVAIQQRAVKSSPGRVVTGARNAMKARGRIPIQVPRVVEVGHCGAGGRSVDYVVEECLEGQPVLRADTGDALDQVLAGISALWTVEPTTRAALPAQTVARIRVSMTSLAQDGPALGLWPIDLDPHRVTDRVLALLDDEPQVTWGLSHGDPGMGNLLRLADGRVALIDWEQSTRRPVSHDVFKALTSSDAPIDRWADLHPPIPEANACPPTELALAMAGFLRTWASRTERARRRGSGSADQRRVRRLLAALDVLLTEAGPVPGQAHRAASSTSGTR